MITILVSNNSDSRTQYFFWCMKVKHIDKGINPSSASQIYFSGVYLLKGFKIGVVAGLIALTVSQFHPSLQENFDNQFCLLNLVYPIFVWCGGFDVCQEAVAIGRTFASMKDYQLDGNKEMVALGAMNIVGSMTSCYVATGEKKTQTSS